MGLAVSEIFYSIQGESSFAGRPFAFVRLAGCNLGCAWCDTAYARQGGEVLSLKEIHRRLEAFPTHLVEVTGGEPLIQDQTPALVSGLCDAGKTVLVETNGSLDISVLDRRAIVIMDIKCPSSGEHKKNEPENITRLKDGDEVKFVIGSRADYGFARKFLEEKKLNPLITPVHFSPAGGGPAPDILAQWILEDGLLVRLNLQIHKILWGDRPGK